MALLSSLPTSSASLSARSHRCIVAAKTFGIDQADLTLNYSPQLIDKEVNDTDSAQALAQFMICNQLQR